MKPRRSAIPLLLVGGLPFAIGAALPLRPGDAGPGIVACPFRALTGLPCPLCGATRAVTLLAHGDPGWASFNLVVPLVLIALFVAGLWLLAGRRIATPSGRAVVLAVVGCVAISWAWTLAHRDVVIT